jgi:thiol:disulfide interchange protein
MPCVLPVITIKIYGFINQAGQSRSRILQLGLAYCAGVFVWFLGLAALIIVFGLNWSFQFQSKAFVFAMLAICLLFGLNLLGAFEFLLPGSLNTKLVALTSKEGVSGAFVHGLFATLLGSACTAPLLGPAVGFALAQPPPVVFAVFAAIATGMALPYFLLTLNPAWLRFLPRPGMWMVRVKQVMGLLVLATAAWFGFILYHQLAAKPDNFPQKLQAALKSGRIVFVDFTAEWCINCKVNEKTVLDSAAVRSAFKENGVEVLRADWTNGNPEITRLLKQFGRAGVPLYVIYPAGGSGQPVVLPELLTQQIVLDGLGTAKQKP